MTVKEEQKKKECSYLEFYQGLKKKHVDLRYGMRSNFMASVVKTTFTKGVLLCIHAVENRLL
jgi:hypothetical protein